MLRLLVDTSTWLDLAKRRDGQKWIVAIRLNVQWGNLQLLVPALVIDEFQRNRPRIESSMTASVAERFRQMRRDFDEYGGETHKEAIEAIDKLAHQVPLIGAMTTRNFDEILNLLQAGERIEPTDDQRSRVVQRALAKKAPFHRQRNSVADALLIEMYASAIASADLHRPAWLRHVQPRRLLGCQRRQAAPARRPSGALRRRRFELLARRGRPGLGAAGRLRRRVPRAAR